MAYFWVPEEGAGRRARRDRVPYDQWIRDEYIDVWDPILMNLYRFSPTWVDRDGRYLPLPAAGGL